MITLELINCKRKYMEVIIQVLTSKVKKSNHLNVHFYKDTW